MAEKNPTKSKSGPEPERVKIAQPWEKAVADALKRKRPEKGWPEEQKSSKKKPA